MSPIYSGTKKIGKMFLNDKRIRTAFLGMQLVFHPYRVPVQNIKKIHYARAGGWGDLAAGRNTVWILQDDGTFLTAGRPDYGMLCRNVGMGSALKTNLGVVDLPPVSDFVVSPDVQALYVLGANGDVYSAGRNTQGQLARAIDGNDGDHTNATTNFGRIGGLPPIAAIGVQNGSALFLARDGRLFSCGAASRRSKNSLHLPEGTGDGGPTSCNLVECVTSLRFNRLENLLCGGCVLYDIDDTACFAGGFERYNQHISKFCTKIDGLYLWKLDGFSGIGTIRCLNEGDLAYMLLKNGELYSSGENGRGQLGRIGGWTSENGETGTLDGFQKINVPPVRRFWVQRMMQEQSGHWHPYALFVSCENGDFYSGGYCERGLLGGTTVRGSRTVVNLARRAMRNVRKIEFACQTASDRKYAWDVFFVTDNDGVWSEGYRDTTAPPSSLLQSAACMHMRSNYGTVGKLTALPGIVDIWVKGCANGKTAYYLTENGRFYSAGYAFGGLLCRNATNSNAANQYTSTYAEVTGLGNIVDVETFGALDRDVRDDAAVMVWLKREDGSWFSAGAHRNAGEMCRDAVDAVRNENGITGPYTNVGLVGI